MTVGTTLSRLARRTGVLLATVPAVVTIAQPLEAHATSLSLYTWVLTDGPCTMTVRYSPGDLTGGGTSTLSADGMSCAVAEQSLTYSIYDLSGVNAGGLFTLLCGTGRTSNFNDVSVTSIPGASCSDPQTPGVHTIYVTMAVEVSTDVYVDQQYNQLAVVP